MDKQQFIANKMKILVGKEGYSRPQAYQIALNYYEKEGQKAQQGMMFNQSVPQNIGYTLPNLNTLPTQGYDFSYNNTFNPQPIENNPSFGQPNMFSNPSYSVPQDLGYNFNPQQSFANYNQTANREESSQEKNYYDTNRVNIVNPSFGINLEQALNFTGQAFGNKEYGKAATGTGLSALKGVRNFLSGYSTGKENRRVGQEYFDNRFADNRNYTYGQQGGKMTEADVIAQNAITDQGQANTNLEGDEFVMRNNGQVQPVVGDKHIENGKVAKGVNVQLNDGDKVLSDYMKLKPTDIKELKERYNVSLKKGATFADAQNKLDQKLGIKKLETEKAELLQKIEKAINIKDESSRELSLTALNNKSAGINEKLNTLSGVRASNFEFLFQRQEAQPKKDTSKIYDKNGKEVEETNETVAQQGMRYTTNQKSDDANKMSNVLNAPTSEDNLPLNIRKIKSVQSGVTNDKLGDGYYIYYDKLPTDAGFDVNRNREFVTQEAYKNTVFRTPAYQEYMRGLAQKESTVDQRMAVEEFQQGGIMELASKYDISPERVQELMSMQQGGMIKRADGSYSKRGLWDNIRDNEGSGKEPTKEMLEQERKVKNYQEGGEETSQIFQMVAQMIQQGEDPNMVVESLMQQGLEQAVQIVEQVVQQMQPEQMTAQQGGEKDYYQQAGKKLDPTIVNSTLLTDFSNQPAGINTLPYTARDTNPNAIWQGENYLNVWKPLVEQSLSDPEQAKKIDSWLTENKGAFSPNIQKQLEGLTGEDRINKIKNLATDEKPGLFHNAVLEAIKSVKAEDAETTSPQEQPTQTDVEARTNVKDIVADFPNYVPLFTPMQSIAKETIGIPRAEAIKTTPEAMLAEAESKRLADVARIQQSGLSPQQQEAILAQGLASSQMASNDAISRVEQANAQSQFQADQYNLGAQAKEDIMNAQFRQDYAGKALETIANTEQDIENKRRSAFLQDVANQNKVINMNTANALNENFSITPTGIEYLNNKPTEFPKMFIPKSVYDRMTAEEVNILKKKAGSTGMQLQIS